MQAVKSVTQSYTPPEQILRLLDSFSKMVNDCIRIGVSQNISSMRRLSLTSYQYLRRYKLYSGYRLTAISKAAGLLRNYRRIKRGNPDATQPYLRRQCLTDCYGFRIIAGKLRLPIEAGRYFWIPLNRHVLAVLSSHTPRSICLTACTVSISYSKQVAEIEPRGLIGIDRNRDNATTASSDGIIDVHNFSRASQIKSTYREVKSHFTRNDVRVRRQIFDKYGRLQRYRVGQVLHHASKKIVQEAKEKCYGIVMEKLKGIRKLYRKGNGQGKKYRSTMNAWSFYELQRQIQYKAGWEGIPVIYVPPQKTSSVCAICGSKITECAERKVYCPNCRVLVDRDENAAKNILARGLRLKPIALSREAVKRNPPTEVILRADGRELTVSGEYH